MANYPAKIIWTRDGAVFTDKKYSRGHSWEFDGGAKVRASSSPHSVPRHSDPTGVDPEEAFVASLSSCHMLTFVWIAAKKGFIVDSYIDNADGTMEKIADNRFAMTVVTLKPKVVFSGDKRPTAAEIEEMHHQAHEECYIANSVKTDVRCEPVL